MAWTRVLGCSALVFVGCGDEERSDQDTAVSGLTAPTGATGTADPDTANPDTDDGPGSASSTGEDSTNPSGSPTSDSSDAEIKFDLGQLPDAPPLQMDGCGGIDFLFAIDNSGSMSAQQTRLVNSFDGFIQAIENSLENVDSFHVGVVSSDAYFPNQPGCQTIGDLVTQSDTGVACGPFVDGNRFLTDADDIATEFPCIARVGTGGSFLEMPVTAAAAALSDAKAQPGACNEGFLRDDAILVLIIITDDPPSDPDFDDAHPNFDTTPWVPAILAAKDNNPEAVVVIGFIPWQNVSCVTFGIESPNLINFVDAFGEQGIKASVCEPDFGPIFASTIETIQTTCDNFDPQG